MTVFFFCLFFLPFHAIECVCSELRSARLRIVCATVIMWPFLSLFAEKQFYWSQSFFCVDTFDCVMNMFISGALRGTLPGHWLGSSEKQCGTLGHLHTPHQGAWPDTRWAKMMLHIQYQSFIQDFFREGGMLMRAMDACACCCTHRVFMKFWTYLRSRNVRVSYNAFCL